MPRAPTQPRTSKCQHSPVGLQPPGPWQGTELGASWKPPVARRALGEVDVVVNPSRPAELVPTRSPVPPYLAWLLAGPSAWGWLRACPHPTQPHQGLSSRTPRARPGTPTEPQVGGCSVPSGAVPVLCSGCAALGHPFLSLLVYTGESPASPNISGKKKKKYESCPSR